MVKEHANRVEIGFGGISPLAPPSPHRDQRGSSTRDGWAEHDAERLGESTRNLVLLVTSGSVLRDCLWLQR